jgi:hypothetical protein
MFKIKHLEDFDKLNLPIDAYVILGSAAAIVAGMPIKNNDIDVCVSPSYINMLLEDKLYYDCEDRTYHDISKNIDILVIDNSDVFGFNDYFDRSVVIDGHRYLNKEGLIMFYTDLCNNPRKNKYKNRLDWLRMYCK